MAVSLEHVPSLHVYISRDSNLAWTHDFHAVAHWSTLDVHRNLSTSPYSTHHPLHSSAPRAALTMSSPRALAALARSRPTSHLLLTSARTAFATQQQRQQQHLASFTTTTPRSALPAGPPPANFRLPKPVRWNEHKDSIWDQAGNYFRLTEMVRGMWVVIEQFFRPPYASDNTQTV